MPWPARALTFLLFAQAAIPAMTSADLRKRYGPPARTSQHTALTQEIFTLRPGIEAVITYGRDSRACSFALSRTASDEAIEDTALTPLIDELAPPAVRGRKKGEGSHMDGSAGMLTILFENVEIDRMIFSNPGPNFPGAPTATIRLLRTACPNRP